MGRPRWILGRIELGELRGASKHFTLALWRCLSDSTWIIRARSVPDTFGVSASSLRSLGQALELRLTQSCCRT